MTEMAMPMHLRTPANRKRWQEELVWFRKLCLRDRLACMRDGRKREFLPIRAIWGVARFRND